MIGLALTAFLALLAFLWVEPYAGLVHDAQLYALQASTKLFPDALGSDLFVRFGSQDRYSIFPVLHAALARHLGLADASLLLGLGGLFGLFAATRAVLLCLGDPPRWTLPALLLMAFWPVPYGADAALHVAEPFCTPRTFSAALGLIGVAFALRDRAAPALITWAVATAIHPLMAAPAVAVGLLILFPWRRILLYGGGLSALALVAALFGAAIDPAWSRMLRMPLDDEWAAVTLVRAPMISPMHWQAADWSIAFVSVAGPLILGTLAQGMRRRLFLGSAAAGAAGVAATLAGADLAGSALVYQIQPWRALWISHWFGVAGLGLLLARVGAFRIRSDAIVAIGLMGAEVSSSLVGWVPAALTLLYVWVLRRPEAVRWRVHLEVCIALVVLQALAWRIAGLPASWSAREVVRPWTEPSVPAALSDPLLMAVLAIVLCALTGMRSAGWGPEALRKSSTRLIVMLAAAGMAVAWHVLLEIGRVRQSEADTLFGIANRDAVVASLPAQGSVFWGADGRAGWFGLRYPVYLSVMQGAGTVFFRENALEVGRRARHVEAVLGDQRYLRRRHPSAATRPLDATAIRGLCSDPALSAVHLPAPIPGVLSVELIGYSGKRSGVLALCDSPGAR